jgi:hypothetical protein
MSELLCVNCNKPIRQATEGEYIGTPVEAEGLQAVYKHVEGDFWGCYNLDGEYAVAPISAEWIGPLPVIFHGVWYPPKAVKWYMNKEKAKAKKAKAKKAKAKKVKFIPKNTVCGTCGCKIMPIRPRMTYNGLFMSYTHVYESRGLYLPAVKCKALTCYEVAYCLDYENRYSRKYVTASGNSYWAHPLKHYRGYINVKRPRKAKKIIKFVGNGAPEISVPHVMAKTGRKFKKVLDN